MHVRPFSRRRLQAIFISGFVAASVSAAAVRADTALTISGGTTKSDVAASVGYSFTVGATPITVTSLGYYNGAGFLADGASHQVAIYDDVTHAQLGTTATITGTASTVAAAGPSSFIYAAVPSFTLNANTTYDISASNISGTATTGGNQFYLVNATGASMGADLTYGTSRYANGGSTVVYPGTVFGANNVGNIGGNFLYTVPEPASLAAFGLGGAMVFIRRRRSLVA